MFKCTFIMQYNFSKRIEELKKHDKICFSILLMPLVIEYSLSMHRIMPQNETGIIIIRVIIIDKIR